MSDEKKVRVPSRATLTTRAFGALQQAKQAMARAVVAQVASANKHESAVEAARAEVKARESALTGQGG